MAQTARHLALCALGLTLALAGTAGAAAKPLVTPPLIAQTGTRLQCRVLNAGTKEPS